MRPKVINQINKRTGLNLKLLPEPLNVDCSSGEYETVDAIDGLKKRISFKAYRGSGFTRLISVDIWHSKSSKKNPDETILLYDESQKSILKAIDTIVYAIDPRAKPSGIKNENYKRGKRLYEEAGKTVKGEKRKSGLSKEAIANQLLQLDSVGAYKLNVQQKMRQNTKMFVHGAKNGLMIVGQPRTGKTKNVKNTLGNMGIGYRSAKAQFQDDASLYKSLYKNNGKIILLDEADKLIKKAPNQFINILKAALEVTGFGDEDESDIRKVSYFPKRTQKEFFPKKDEDGNIIRPAEYPQSFNYTGKIVFIGNLDAKKIDEAVKGRCIFQEVDMSNEEILELILKGLKQYKRAIPYEQKLEVYNTLISIQENFSKRVGAIDFGIYESALIYRRSSELQKNNIWVNFIFEELVASKIKSRRA